MSENLIIIRQKKNLISQLDWHINVSKKLGDENIVFLEESLLLPNFLKIEYNNNRPNYNSETRLITIPLSYNRSFNSGFTESEKFLKEKTFDFFFFHEVGHGFHHSKLSNEQNFSANPVNFKNDLDNLCNNPTRNLIFNTFLKSTYREAYADCYAAICLYKKYGDINIFDKISEMRKNDLSHYKKTNEQNLFTPYHDYESVLFLKKEIKNLDLLKINSVDEINNLVQKSLTKGLFKTVQRESQSNDSFLKGLRESGNNPQKYKKAIETTKKVIEENKKNLPGHLKKEVK